MRAVDPQAYEPNAVSIGPFYYGDDKLLPIQLQHKLRFYSHLINRSHTAIDHNSLKESVDKLVPRARRCYSHNFDEIPDSEFSLMMVLDGCFILQLFRRDHKLKELIDKQPTPLSGNVIDDPIFDTRWIMPAVRRDLTKMGNQLPFFVLEELYNLTNLSTDHQETSLLEYAISFFAPLLPASAFDVMCASQIQQLGSNHAHLLALFHSTFNPLLGNSSISIKETELTGISSAGSVTELGRYGIKIVKGNGHLLDIKYTRTLKVRPLLLDYGTVHVFHNLVAYEQCGGRSTPSYFTTYVMLLSELMKSSKDVHKLYEQRIIKHTLVNDKEAIAMLRSLCKQIAFDGKKRRKEDVNGDMIRESVGAGGGGGGERCEIVVTQKGIFDETISFSRLSAAARLSPTTTVRLSPTATCPPLPLTEGSEASIQLPFDEEICIIESEISSSRGTRSRGFESSAIKELKKKGHMEPVQAQIAQQDARIAELEKQQKAELEAMEARVRNLVSLMMANLPTGGGRL
ncbi:hypothetical protein LguiA_030123 [Lonicera macranthoides]